MIEFVVAGESHQGTETRPKREVDLFRSLHPNVYIKQLNPLGVQVIFDPQPSAFEKDSSYEKRYENEIG